MTTTRYECPVGSCPWTWDEPEPEPPSMADIAANPLGPLTARFANSEAVLRAHLETHSLVEWVQELARLREAVNGWSRHLLHTSQHNNMQIALGGRIQRVADEMREAVGLPEFGWNDAVPDAEFGECSVHASGSCRGQETHP